MKKFNQSQRHSLNRNTHGNDRKHLLEKFINIYRKNRPFFYCFIRPQEALLFQQNFKYFKKPILDFGCGDGFFAETVFGKNNIDIGLDIKNSRINEAITKKIYKKTIIYDGKVIPFPNNYFSSVIANCVLEHLPNLRNNLKEIFRVLKPNGYFLTSVMTNKWVDYLLGKKIFGNFYLNYFRKKQEHFNLLPINNWQETFENAGFKTIKMIGYLSPLACRYLELYHYLSFPSLLSYRLFKNWTNLPSFFLSKTTTIAKTINKEVNLTNSAAVFFILKK